jgi:hypothetical protein
MFEKFIGSDDSGSGPPLTRAPGLQVYVATNDRLPKRVNPPSAPLGRNRNWCRKGVAAWLIGQVTPGKPFIAGPEGGQALVDRTVQEIDGLWSVPAAKP